MTNLSRRQALLGGAALTALAGCNTGTPVAAENMSPEPGKGASATPPTPKSSTDFIDGIALAAMIADGRTTPAAELEAAIVRAEAVNPEINAIASKLYDQARERVAQDDLSGPFAGVPTFIKDLMHWKGAPTRFGSRAFETFIAEEDGLLSAAWRQAGLVCLGKSTTPEMGLTSTTEPLNTGQTRNPWDLSRMTGGSSGGAAALVAARVVPFAHASDGGGSIRIPASTCGLFGLKPSAARLQDRAGPTPPVDISVSHAVTLSVRDSVGLFRIAERNDGIYPALGEISPLNRKLRIGFAPASTTGSPVASETTKALEDTAQLCRDLGHEVFDFTPTVDGADFLDKFILYWAAGAAQFAKDASAYSGKPISKDIVEPWTLSLMEMFEARESEMPDVIAGLTAFQAEYASWFDSMDVMLTPTTGSPAVPLGEQAPDGPFDTIFKNVTDFAAFTAPMNVAGAASMSVPLGWTDAGLPVGSLFSARKGDDGLLFSLAYQLEEAKPWIDRLPGVHA